MSDSVKHSLIKGCYLVSRGRAAHPMFSDGGNMCVRLEGCAIIPMEEYEHLKGLAEDQAMDLAGAAILKARAKGKSI
jgi:hypothetical protein